MTKTRKKSFALRVRNYFFTGVIVLIPIAFTLYLTKLLLKLVFFQYLKYEILKIKVKL